MSALHRFIQVRIRVCLHLTRVIVLKCNSSNILNFGYLFLWQVRWNLIRFNRCFCALCESCITPNCLKTPDLTRKCRAVVRRDDFKKHTKQHHAGEVSRAVEDKQHSLRNFFHSQASPVVQSSSQVSIRNLEFDEGASISSEGRSFETEHDEYSQPEQSSLSNELSVAPFVQNLNARFDTLESNLSKLMNMCSISNRSANGSKIANKEKIRFWCQQARHI